MLLTTAQLALVSVTVEVVALTVGTRDLFCWVLKMKEKLKTNYQYDHLGVWDLLIVYLGGGGGEGEERGGKGDSCTFFCPRA